MRRNFAAEEKYWDAGVAKAGTGETREWNYQRKCLNQEDRRIS